VVLKPGDRGVVESESTGAPQRTRAVDGVVHEKPAPRNRIRRDDGRNSIDTPAAGALCKAGTMDGVGPRAAQGRHQLT